MGLAKKLELLELGHNIYKMLHDGEPSVVVADSALLVPIT